MLAVMNTMDWMGRICVLNIEIKIPIYLLIYKKWIKINFLEDVMVKV